MVRDVKQQKKKKKTVSLANSEDPNEMWHFISLHCKNLREIPFFENYNLLPSIYTMDNSKFIVSNKKEESINT